MPGAVQKLGGVVAVEAGCCQVYALRADGTVWQWGWVTAIDNYANTAVPQRVTRLSGVRQLAGGDVFALALRDDGTVWGWGWNGNGQLGPNARENRPDQTGWQGDPVQVSGLPQAVDICAGGYFSMAVAHDGTVWSWGSNDAGQLGRGNVRDGNDEVSHPHPGQVRGISGSEAVSCGYQHAVARKADGSVWLWGGDQTGTRPNFGTPVRLDGLPPVTILKARDTTTVALVQP